MTTATQEADKLLEDVMKEDEEKKNATPYTTAEAWHAVWRHIAPHSPTVIGLVILGIFSAILNGSVPFVTGKFFDALIALSNNEAPPSGALPVWMIFLTLWVFLQLATNLTDWIMRNRQEVTWLNLRMQLESNSFAYLLYLPISFHKSTHMGGTINTISNGGWRISAGVRNITTIAPQLLSMVIGITLATSINPTLAGILLGGVLLYATILYVMLRHIAAKDDRAHRTWSKAWEYSAAAVENAEMVKQASAEKHEEEKIKHLTQKRAYETWMKLERHWGNVSFFQHLVVFATQLSVFVFSIHLIREHTITIGELIAVNGYALMFFGPLVQLGYSWQTIQNGVTSAIHLAKLLDTPPEIYAPDGSDAKAPMSGAIRFTSVDFRYEPDQPPVFSELSVEIQSGSVVALVGESGGGKSTMIGLVSAYYFPTKGSVTIDGVDTHAYDLHALRSRIAIVPQEVTLWNDTIKNNIRYGSFSATDEEVERVAKEAHCADFISTFPRGYDTIVGERGVKLSVGQKQRIAIARAMLRDPAILILDEPTSALDAETEHHITEALTRLMKGRTTLIIAHRLSTVRRADNILVFEKGHIAESGTHDALLKKEDGIYRKLHDHQIGLYG